MGHFSLFTLQLQVIIFIADSSVNSAICRLLDLKNVRKWCLPKIKTASSIIFFRPQPKHSLYSHGSVKKPENIHI